MRKIILSLLWVTLVSGCSTATYVKLPENSVLKIKRGTERPFSEGRVKRTPLSWSSAGGIPYKIERDGEIIQEGRLRSSFRPASIFWPPAGAIYWPMGFSYKCYDLTGEMAKSCSDEVYTQLRNR